MDFHKIEKKWQKKWEEEKVFYVKESKKKKFFILEMFPYPSSSGLHMGHALNYTIGDVFSRHKIMNGFNVLHPMGYDSLGLPAENAAIKAGVHPKKYTEKSIKNFVKQQKALGLTYDWSRVLSTSDSKYYKWDQWIFLQLLKKGLAYQKTSAVNWCPKCNTVLANEQVHSGKCWRHGDTNVEVKHLKQWYFKTTEYSEELNDFKELDKWPELIKKLQKNWIGKSYGAEIMFEIKGEKWPIFTTRPDTLFGVTFMVISAQHPKLMNMVTDENKKKMEKFVSKLSSVSQEEIDQLEKEGVFTGSYAVHPLTHEKVPVYAGNFVIAEYGSGMVMAVPAHDQRDFEFAKKYKIPIKQVIVEKGKKSELKEAFTGEGVLVNSGKFDDMGSVKAKDAITKELKKKKLGSQQVNFRLRDWLISRQRFWGTPIPIVHCEKCGAVPVPEKDLPIELPMKVKFGEGNPLETSKAFVNTKCPKCKKNAKRETDTMDTFVNSSWYYLRYADANNDKKIFNPKKANYWCPIDMYIGGKEHACMHLIYIRFYTKFLRDIGLLKFNEPAITLFNQGMLHASDGNKMSKSLGNVVDPLVTIDKYSTDSLRIFLISVASPDSDFNWDDKGVEASYKFLNKVVAYFDKVKVGKSSPRSESKANKAIKEISQDMDRMRYNLAVIKLRQMFDNFEEVESKANLESFVKMLTPFCPHLSEELWKKLGNKEFVSVAKWPKCNEKKIDEKIEFEEEVVLTLSSDVEEIKKLAKIEKLKSVKLIVAPKWKYKFVKEFKKAVEKERNVGVLIKKLMVKEHGKDISKLVPMFVKSPSKVPKIVLSQKGEEKVLKDQLKSLEEQFGCKVVIELAEKSKESKVRNAMPSKPAIIVE